MTTPVCAEGFKNPYTIEAVEGMPVSSGVQQSKKRCKINPGMLHIKVKLTFF